MEQLTDNENQALAIINMIATAHYNSLKEVVVRHVADADPNSTAHNLMTLIVHAFIETAAKDGMFADRESPLNYLDQLK